MAGKRVIGFVCPHCGERKSYILDSRWIETGGTRRRYRKCTYCGKTFSTFEQSGTSGVLQNTDNLKKILFPFLGERFGTYLLYRNGEVEKGPEYVLRYSTRRAVIQDFDTGEVMASGECLKPSNPKAVPESPRVLRESTNAVDRIAEMVTEEVLKRFGPAPSAPPVPPAIHLPTKEEKLVMIREAAERRKQNQRLSRLEQMEQGDYSDLGDDKLDFETYTNDEWEQ